MSNQFNGLLLKNIQLIKRQTGSLVCQIITPILCLGFIALIKMIVESQIKNTGLSIKNKMPFLFNLPIYSKFQYTKDLIKITNCEEWYLYDFGPNAQDKESREFFGYNDGLKEGNSSGILKGQTNLIQSKCEQINRMSPYFVEKSGNETLNFDLYDRLEHINELDFNKLNNETNISILPDGAFLINKVNSEELSYTVSINDNRLPPYHRSNGITKLSIYNQNKKDYTPVVNVINGILWTVDLINKSYFRKFFDDVFIVSGVQIMPFKQDDNDNVQRIINLAGSTFYPMAVSLLMPLFLYTIVLEKEGKLIEIMKINGMKMRFYWLSNFSFNFMLYALTMIVFNIFGSLCLGLTLFTKTNTWILLFIYIGWGLCQVGMAFFFQAFLNNARSATIIGYIISLWTTLLAVSLNITIFDLPKKMPIWLLFYPSFNICRIFYHLTMKCGYEACISSFETMPEELVTCIWVLFVSGLLYIFIGMYLYEVIPQQFGVRRHPLFCVKKLIKKLRSKKNKIKTELDNSHEISNIMNNDLEMDDEIKTEVEQIKEMGIDKKEFPLVVDKLTKIYGSTKTGMKPKKALNGLSLILKNDEIFGLLGPNGAGKTTFFSMLTGIYEPTFGDAWVGGFSIKENIDKVQEMIGYCPQFDLLWNDLSVEDHLYFYSRLKNVQSNSIKSNVEKTLKDTKLERFRTYLVRELSGGMKRRLSLGISIVGNPQIVFLDEPTTGLDPQNKRQIWEILSNCKENKCIILTTHLMEEVEVLSDRIGIIVNGSLKCLGTQHKLKKVYGKGFKLVLNLISINSEISKKKNIGNLSEEEFLEDRSQNLQKFIKSIFPNAIVEENFKNTLIFFIPNEEFEAEILFDKIQKEKDKLMINNWAISQVTLEDIFIKLTENEI